MGYREQADIQWHAGMGVGGAAGAIKQRATENWLKRVTEMRIKKWAQGQVNKKGSCGDGG